jgi:hypothetical protein
VTDCTLSRKEGRKKERRTHILFCACRNASRTKVAFEKKKFCSYF